MAVFINPNKQLPLDLGSLFGGIVENGPIAQPTARLTDRFAGAMDLLNHGFATEAVLIAFSTFEGWLRRGLTRALSQNLDIETAISKEIRGAKFFNCISALAARARWSKLDDISPGLKDDLQKVYTVRNQLMHEAMSIGRADAEWCVECIAWAMRWLQKQLPDFVPALPPGNVAVPGFVLWNPGDLPIFAEPPQASAPPFT